MLLAGYGVSLFLSAFLLFSIQPMISRMALPRLGGAPAVWNACAFFFQAALLLGYAYANFIAGRLQLRTQILIHALVLAAALVVLPLSLGAGAPPPDASPVGWLLTRLTIAAGAPFVAAAATAPLLQHWFSRTTAPRAQDPYFLYVASNFGSLLALLSYPALIETTLDLSAQASLWSATFLVAVCAILACGVASQRYWLPEAPPLALARASVARRERLRWVTLSFLPSALMLAVTTHITTDIAAAPLFWVAPLAIYIVTFMFAFARRQIFNLRHLRALQAVGLAAAGVAAFIEGPGVVGMIASLAVFTLTALVCHIELAQRRPDIRDLTAYYMLISLGGALGGFFGALLAPALFSGPWEYPLLLVGACLLRPAPTPLSPQGRENWAIRGDLLLPVVLIAFAVATLWLAGPTGLDGDRFAARAATAALLFVALLRFARRRMRLAMAMAGCLFFPLLVDSSNTMLTTRSFFGVHRVRQLPDEDVIVLQHGTTIHGVQSVKPGEERVPLGYYHASGPFGRAFAVLRRRAEPMTSIGVLGLGTGGLGCYARPGESWTFREIDATVERLASDDRWFHFLARCGNGPTVVLGDARLTLAADSGARYDLLIVDVFSSDAVPIHLITREALTLYFARLKPKGVVLFHVSNRYLNLTPVVARLAMELRAPVRHLFVEAPAAGRRQLSAEVAAVAAPGGDLDDFAADGWDAPSHGPVLWTDERSDILRVIRWR